MDAPGTSWIEVVSLAGAISSIILAVVAIGLSVVFFIQSSRWSDKFDDAAKEISHNVERLETLFDKLYTDTFAMMRDTVGDIRKHAWPDSLEEPHDIENELSERFQALEHRLNERVQALTSDARLNPAQRDQVERLVREAVTETQEIEHEVPTHVARRVLLHELTRGHTETAGELVSRLPLPSRATVEALRELLHAGLINSSTANEIMPESRIRLSRAGLDARSLENP